MGSQSKEFLKEKCVYIFFSSSHSPMEETLVTVNTPVIAVPLLFSMLLYQSDTI